MPTEDQRTRRVRVSRVAGSPAAKEPEHAPQTKPTTDGAAELAWQKTEKEIKRGYTRGPFPVEAYDLGRVAISPRFPKWERKEDGSWAVRNITDLDASGAPLSHRTEVRFARLLSLFGVISWARLLSLPTLLSTLTSRKPFA